MNFLSVQSNHREKLGWDFLETYAAKSVNEPLSHHLHRNPHTIPMRQSPLPHTPLIPQSIINLPPPITFHEHIRTSNYVDFLSNMAEGMSRAAGVHGGFLCQEAGSVVEEEATFWRVIITFEKAFEQIVTAYDIDVSFIHLDNLRMR